MPRQKKTTGKTPANKQKGTKVCSSCHEEKKLTDFYYSASPLYVADKRVPICKKCVIKLCVTDTGEIDEIELNKTLRILDKPYFKDSLNSAVEQFSNEHNYIDHDKIKFYGDKILGIFFKNLVLRQNRNLSYSDSEKLGFMHRNSNIPVREREKIARKYADLQNQYANSDEDDENLDEVKWTKKDKQNMKYVVSTIGYDPFDDIGLSESDKKYCFNILSGYCDTDGVLEDGHKMQCVIEMTMLYCQCKKINEEMNRELDNKSVDDNKISKLASSKSTLLSSIATLARDNNISSNYNKNSKHGQNSFTSKMKEMAENGFSEIEVNLFDIKTSEAFRQIDEISNTNIANQLTLDSNEYTEIIKEQREMIQKYDIEVEQIKEENRILKNKIIDLENKKR